MKSNPMLHWTSLLALALIPATANAQATLGGNMTADNAFFAYLGTNANSLGTPVASGTNWPTSYALTSTALTPGVTNYLNIEAINMGGPGGLAFDLSLTGTGFDFGNGATTISTDPANLSYFTASYNNANSSATAQPWVAATGGTINANAYYNWGNVVGTPSWIDAAGTGLNTCGGYCTVDFTVPIYSTAAAPVPEPASWALMLTGFAVAGAALRRRVRARAAFG